MSQASFEINKLTQTEEQKAGSDTALQLSHIDINEEYRKKWNVHEQDFVLLTRNGEPIRNTLYRVGGLGASLKDDYFMILKHTEAFYDDTLTKDKNKKPHLESCWCILDNKNGIEKVTFKPFASPYLVKNTPIFSLDSKYYNIETGELYCNSYSKMECKDFVFLDNAYDDDKSKRGVMKINKKDGTWELFPAI